ncbi:MAG: carboxypeptidase regulatory-like domain-containing protein [Rhodopirellula sp. JB044]|uniref:carboxypeptidase regulatory-like domain-containing protein n=1 Tax=Rhodopirellula sp. JB044 TaxID=3342844 RepID=UPI00370C835F
MNVLKRVLLVSVAGIVSSFIGSDSIVLGQSRSILTGTVTNSSGEPIAGVNVNTTVPVSDSPRGRYREVGTVQTDAQGRFEFDEIEVPTRVTLGFTKPGFVDQWAISTPDKTLDVVMHRSRTVSGTVKDYKGNAVPHAAVNVVPLNEARFPILRYTTDESGVFQIDQLPPPPFRLVFTAESSSPQAVDVDSQTEQKKFDLRLLPGRKATFFVKDSNGDPVADALVSSVKWRGHAGVEFQDRTDSQGRCTFRCVPSDEVQYVVSHPDYRDTAIEFAAAKDACEVVLSPMPEEANVGGIDPGTGSRGYQSMHLCQPDGTVIRPFLRDRELALRYCRHGSPNISADGSTVAFDAREDIAGYDWQDGHVIVADSDGDNARVLSDGMIPSLSPDGSHIAFSRVSKYGSKDGARGQSIWTMKCDGTNLKMVADSGAWGVHWTADGRSLVFIGGVDSDGSYHRWDHLRLYDLETETIQSVWSSEESPFSSVGFHFNTSHRGRLVVVTGRLREGGEAFGVLDLDRGLESLHLVQPSRSGAIPVLQRTMEFHLSNRFLIVTSGEGGTRHPELWSIEGQQVRQKFPGLPLDREVKDAIYTLDGQHLIAVINSVGN